MRCEVCCCDGGVITDSGFLDYDVWIGKYLRAFRAFRWSVLLRHDVLHQELILTHVACVVFLEFHWLGFLYSERSISVVIGR